MTDEQCDDCPNCGAPTAWGYGLAGGGIGTYRYCTECDYFDKTQDSDDDIKDERTGGDGG